MEHSLPILNLESAHYDALTVAAATAYVAAKAGRFYTRKKSSESMLIFRESCRCCDPRRKPSSGANAT